MGIGIVLLAAAAMLTTPLRADDVDGACELQVLLARGGTMVVESMERSPDGWVFLHIEENQLFALPDGQILGTVHTCCIGDEMRAAGARRFSLKSASSEEAVDVAGMMDAVGTSNARSDLAAQALPARGEEEASEPSSDRWTRTGPGWAPRTRYPKPDPYAQRRESAGPLDLLRNDIPWWTPQPRRSRPDPYAPTRLLRSNRRIR